MLLLYVCQCTYVQLHPPPLPSPSKVGVTAVRQDGYHGLGALISVVQLRTVTFNLR